jgi:hypothetical protein
MDVDKLKKGDYVVYTNDATNYYAIARFIQKSNQGVYLNAGKYGGFDGKKDLHIKWLSYIPICGIISIRMATQEEIDEYEKVVKDNGYTWVTDHYVKTSQISEFFKDAKFGDKFLTTSGKLALFLRFCSNDESNFASLYVQDYGQVQYYVDGRVVIPKLAHYNIKEKL